jgi:hypothetical protein
MPVISDPRARLRLEIGDGTAPFLLTDDELDTLLSERAGVILAAAADACDILATRFATAYDFEWQGSVNSRGKYSRSQMSKAFADRAKAIRARVNGGLTVVQTTRVDGYSDDLSNRDGAGQASKTGRVRAGYTDPDLPV